MDELRDLIRETKPLELESMEQMLTSLTQQMGDSMEALSALSAKAGLPTLPRAQPRCQPLARADSSSSPAAGAASSTSPASQAKKKKDLLDEVRPPRKVSFSRRTMIDTVLAYYHLQPGTFMWTLDTLSAVSFGLTSSGPEIRTKIS